MTTSKNYNSIKVGDFYRPADGSSGRVIIEAIDNEYVEFKDIKNNNSYFKNKFGFLTRYSLIEEYLIRELEIELEDQESIFELKFDNKILNDGQQKYLSYLLSKEKISDSLCKEFIELEQSNDLNDLQQKYKEHLKNILIKFKLLEY